MPFHFDIKLPLYLIHIEDMVAGPRYTTYLFLLPFIPSGMSSDLLQQCYMLPVTHTTILSKIFADSYNASGEMYLILQDLGTLTCVSLEDMKCTRWK